MLEGVRDLTLIKDIFALETGSLINFKPIFSSNRNQSINLKGKEDEWLQQDVNTFISNCITKQLTGYYVNTSVSNSLKRYSLLSKIFPLIASMETL